MDYEKYDNYTNYIGSFINNDIRSISFKKHPQYCYMLEHVTKSLGDIYLYGIYKKFNPLINQHKKYFVDLCHINDSCGNPEKCSFDNFTTCSPSNLRYIYQGLLILSYMKDCMLNNIDVIEIGGGYGGLCFFIHKLAILFNINISSYSIFDLKNPLLLQEKYLQNLKISNMNYVELDSIKNIKQNSFLISNYAFSEVAIELQKKYSDNVLNPYVSHGFLAWNYIDIYNFIDNKHIEVEAEHPSTGNKNYYVRFKPLV